MNGDAILWIEIADKDLDAIRRALTPDPHTNNEVAAYHCQQAAEKLIKAVLVYEQIPYPRGSGGHDLARNVRELPDSHPLAGSAAALVGMTPWATAFRYPVDDPLVQEPIPDVPMLSASMERLIEFRDAVIQYVTPCRPGRP